MIDFIFKSTIIGDIIFFFQNLDIRFRYLYKNYLFIFNFIILEFFVVGIQFLEFQYPDLSMSKYFKNLNNIIFIVIFVFFIS